jgi:cytochrome P450
VTNPDLYRRLQQEIDTGISDGKVSSPVTDAEAKELPLLQACIKEALRIWPPITGIMPKISDKDAVLCGVPVPAGTRVAWAPKACFRDKELFGEDADIYRPDRFLLAEPEKQTAMLNAVDLCFGAGRWVCLGRQIAYSQINKALVEVCSLPTYIAVICVACSSDC